MKVVAENRKARYDYHLDDTLEVGIVLLGTEVKSAREGKVQLRDSYVLLRNGELFVMNLHIAPYSRGFPFNHDPYRARKLLAHREEIDRLAGRIKARGYALVPTRFYFNDRGIAKLEIALARGKRKADKREAIKEREAARAIERALRQDRRLGERRARSAAAVGVTFWGRTASTGVVRTGEAGRGPAPR